jgi:hypothetical protein
MFAFPDVLDFFADEFSCLGGWRLSLTGIFPGSFDCFLFGHFPLSCVRLTISDGKRQVVTEKMESDAFSGRNANLVLELRWLK